MNYFEYRFTGKKDIELLVAYLSQWPFESFMEQEVGLSAYIQVSIRNEEMDESVNSIAEELGFSLEIIEIAWQNWNEIWETQFDPVIVPGFCTIVANFHKIEIETPYKIIVNPKMAFGTGHHETTFMMIEAMKEIDFNGKKVFDFGTGTGVLAILAEQLGALSILAIDNDPLSIENALENAKSNRCEKIEISLNTINEVIFPQSYDLILANINRNVLLDSTLQLAALFKKNGDLLVSGVLKTQLPDVIEAFGKVGFKLNKQLFKSNWSMVHFIKH